MFVVAAAAAASLGTVTPPAAPRLSPFAPAIVAAQSAASATQDDPSIVRSRYVTIDLDAFTSAPAASEPAVTLELFPNQSVVAVFDRFDPNPDGVTWVGHVQNLPLSTVTMVYSQGFVVGTVAAGLQTFSIRPAPADVRAANPQPAAGVLHMIAEVDQSKLMPEAEPIVPAISAGDLAAASDHPMKDTADTVDVMVVYTTNARALIGGQAIMNNLINLGVSETNTSYANSGVSQRIRLVHTVEVDYTEVNSFSTNLTNLRGGVGALSGIPALRDAHRADLVTMLVRPPVPDACGIAFVMTNVSTAFAPSGYSVTDTTCVSPGYTFAHELGHNMGAQHDWYMTSTTLPFTYAHGYVNIALGQRWRTLMSYNDNCAALGFICTRLLQWANPARKRNSFCTEGGPSTAVNCSLMQYWFFSGTPLGVPQGTSTACVAGRLGNPNCDADDARTLNNTALTIANLRQVTTAADERRYIRR